MGHWSEGLVEELASQIGDNPDRVVLKERLAQTGREIEILAGREFHPPREAASVFVPNGLPFVDVPDLLVGSMEAPAGPWAIPDPVNSQIATVLQVSVLSKPASKATPIADALWIAGQLIARASEAGRLSRDYILHWLGTNTDHEQRMDLFRRVMDPTVHFSVPLLGVAVEGWWFQITRRLIWVTGKTSGPRLMEPLLSDKASDPEIYPLVASEPILIAARMTHQPADWAFTARIWPEGVQLPVDQQWSTRAAAIHGYGIPIISIDSLSSQSEIACQAVLKGYWHGYVDSSEPALAQAVARAYPKQVQRIQRGTGAPDRMSAAATLLEQLVRPGFDPAQGAEATRRYVRRKANIAVMQHRKREAPERYPWTQVGITERRYYKLLPLFAQKVNGRYEVDHDDVVTRMKAYLNASDDKRIVRTAALDVLRSRGFSDAAARKWLQRHPPEDAVDAWPRGRRSPNTESTTGQGAPDPASSDGSGASGEYQ